MVGIDVHIAGNTPRTANPGDNDLFVLRYIGLQNRLGIATHNDPNSATRAPYVGHTVSTDDFVKRMAINDFYCIHGRGFLT